MKREKLLRRQGGERQLGLSSLREDFVTACVRLSSSPVKRHREHGVQLLQGVGDLHLDEPHDHHYCTDHNTKTRECVTRTLQIIEHDWVPPLPADDDEDDDDDDCKSYTTVATGMPSLASINPGSVTDASCSYHSGCGLSRFSSMTSMSSHCNNTGSCDPEDSSSVASQSTGIVSEEPAFRNRMKVLLLEDINEEARAETLDCLEPVLVSSRDNSWHERTRWGSPPSCDTEITVCRPQEHYETSSIRRTKSDCMTSASRRHPQYHELASRNADDAPPLPPPVSRVLSIDQSPMVPRRYCTSEVYLRPRPPTEVDRRKSWDQVPYKPKRKNSTSRCTA